MATTMIAALPTTLDSAVTPVVTMICMPIIDPNMNTSACAKLMSSMMP